MTYIVYFEWKNTAGNHAGMAYLFRRIKQFNPKEVRLIRVPVWAAQGNKYLQRIYLRLIVLFFYLFVSKESKILLTEYLGNCSGNQTRMAELLRKYGWKGKIFGLVHLSEAHLLELYGSHDYIQKGLQYLDQVWVLGSSLASYFARLGYGDKTWCTFHYVDTNYYSPQELKKTNDTLNVIAMGSLKRNHKKLCDIIAQTPMAHYTICMGGADLTAIFEDLPNVRLCGFMSEEELRTRMQDADVSLSVLDDTVGSNVITTSLACGLPQVVSDVGSIRDYCSETNTIFCNDVNDFVEAIQLLDQDRARMQEMSINARKRALEIDINVFNELFKRQIEK